MSLKIHGNLSPKVGKEEKYTIKEPFEGFNIFPPPIQPIDHKVKWYVYVLENGKWRKTKENDKTGETVSYTFTQKSLSRKGIKIEVQRGFETASEVIKPQRAEEQKILKVELLDTQENKLTKPLSYGQTVVAKATCTGLEYQMVSLTLWEDDAKGAGHSPINQKNRATTKTVEVKRGIAKTSFKLMPSFDKMAKAFQTAGGEGKLHEYYVTASIQDKLSASNNIDVKALEEPVPPVKKKVPVIDPKKPRPNVPKSSTPTKPSVKKEITDVKLFKTSETTLKAHVYYNGLQGKKIRFKLMEDDGGALFNDENQVFDLPKNSDCLYIDIALKKVSKSKGDDMLEGWEQELFVDIEVIETASHHKTATLNVNNSGFGSDPVDDTNKVVKVGEEKKEKGKCQKEGNVTVNEEKGTVVVVSGKGSKMISNWVVYETNVYFNITLSTFKKLQNENKIPKPDYTTYLSRDAHGEKAKYGKHSDKRYGRANETPPGEYYLIPAVAGQSYKVYLSSDGKSASITGPDGNRDGVAIHQYSAKYAIGCLTTVSGKDTSIVDGFLNILEDLPLGDNRPVRIIIEERKVKEETWSDSSIGTKKWTGIL